MFQFDDYYFRQIQGREMGNPFTCMWAVAHFALVEHLILDSRHKSNIIVLVRFIDDTFVIWKRLRLNLIVGKVSNDVLIKRLI